MSLSKEEKMQRVEKIIEMGREGKGMKEIADHFGLSRQRMLQILDAVGGEPRNMFRRKPARALVKFECHQCHKQVEAKHYRRYCSSQCRILASNRSGYPRELIGDKAAQLRWRYVNDPGYYKRLKAAQKRYMDKVKADPVRRAHHLKVMRDYGKIYLERKKKEQEARKQEILKKLKKRGFKHL